MNNEQVTASSVETASECFALVYDSKLAAITLTNVRAVISISKLTRDQYIWASDEFTKRYTGTKHVDIVPEQVLHAHFSSGIPQSALCCTAEELRNQSEAHNYLKLIAETLHSIHNEIRGHREDLTTLKRDVATLNERLQQPIPVFDVLNPNPVTQEDIDELFDGIDVNDKRWVSQKEYANAIKCAVSTLQKYREKNSGIVFYSKNPLMGKDKAGNIFLKHKGKETLYLLR